MIFGAILAGGIGSRMDGADMPKQFLPLKDKPIIIHTLERFLLCERFEQLYVGAHADWIDYMNSLINQYLPKDKSKITVTPGGENRNETVLNIVHTIEYTNGTSQDHIIVVHDAARPFLTLRMIEENIDAALTYGAADTVLPAIDTIIVSEDGQQISDIPDRRHMYQGQTPQSFQVSTLKELYYSLSEEEKTCLTDSCQIYVKQDYPVHLVQGSVTNIKITTQADYKMAQALAKEGIL